MSDNEHESSKRRYSDVDRSDRSDRSPRRGGYSPANKRRRLDRDEYDSGRGGGGGRDQSCFKWAQGTCSYGDRCRFTHDGPGGSDRDSDRNSSRRRHDDEERRPRSYNRSREDRYDDRDDRRDDRRDERRETRGGTDLFMRGLDYNMSKRDVEEELLADTRGMNDLVLPMSRENMDQNRGFAIIKFDSESDARDAMDRLDGQDCRGRVVHVEFSHGRGGGRRERRDDGYSSRGGGGGGRSGGGECYNFARSGDCRYGESCRFTHSRSDGGRGSGRDDY